MRLIAHISDLHFGREDAQVSAALLEDLRTSSPDLLAVSGDLTQRARRREFAVARDFLDGLPFPRLVVPGNHDIPLFDVPRRFLWPLARFRRYIQAEENPFFLDAELAVQGVNTARSNTWKDGRLSPDQIALLRERLCPLPEDLFKVVVTHHPFVPPSRDPAPPTVGRGLQALQVAEACGVDLLLAGHLHEGYTADVRAHHVSIRRSILVVQAGTAISHRRRGEPNTYNLIKVERIKVERPRLSFELRAWDGRRFAPARVTRYCKQDDEWRLEA